MTNSEPPQSELLSRLVLAKAAVDDATELAEEREMPEMVLVPLWEAQRGLALSIEGLKQEYALRLIADIFDTVEGE